MTMMDRAATRVEMDRAATRVEMDRAATRVEMDRVASARWRWIVRQRAPDKSTLSWHWPEDCGIM
jgi:hypothetical protein